MTRQYVLVFESLDAEDDFTPEPTDVGELAWWIESQLELTGPDVKIVKYFERERS
jgi:hypothetical protein